MLGALFGRHGVRKGGWVGLCVVRRALRGFTPRWDHVETAAKVVSAYRVIFVVTAEHDGSVRERVCAMSIVHFMRELQNTCLLFLAV